MFAGTMHFYSSKDILEPLIEVGDTLNGPTTPMMKEYFIAIIQSSINSRHNGTFISHSNGIKFYTRRSDALKVNQMPFENQITRLIRTIRTLCSHLLLSLFLTCVLLIRCECLLSNQHVTFKVNCTICKQSVVDNSVLKRKIHTRRRTKK